MPLINTAVPNLIQGVSQQPDATRYAGQCEEQENALSSVADGLKKRPNTRHVARLLTTAIAEDSFVHFIDRDDNEKYVVIHDGFKLRVFNLNTGNEGTINESANKYYDPANGSYLDTSTPRNDLKALTVADNTFLLNTTKTVEEATTRTADLDKKALIFVKQGDYQKRYEIKVGDSPFPQVSVDLASSGGSYHRVKSFEIRHQGYGLSRFKFKIGNTEYPSTETFDSDGRLTSMTPTSSNYYTGSFGWNATYTAGSQPFPTDNYFGVATHTSGGANENQGGKNADASVIAQNLVTTLDHTVPPYTNNTPPVTDSNGANSRQGANLEDNFSTSRNGAVISLEKDTTGDFTISVSDGLAGGGLGCVYKEIDSLSSLPLVAPDGFEVKVIGDAELNQDDYYVRFSTNSSSGFGDGTWKECVGYNTIEGLNDSTLPMRLISTAVDTFDLEPIEFSKRTAGDSDTNPSPSFVNKNISNLFYFKNRLGFITEDSVAMSEAGESFNFYRTTVTSLLDSDPIDVTVSSNKVTKLKAAKGFQENLILFSDNTQFVMKGGELLTPKTVSVNPITNFNFEDEIDPLPLGSYIYFPFTRGSYSGIREFTINSTTDTYDSVEITEHIPAYIPKNIIGMAGTTTEDLLVILSGDETDALYIYNYFWNNNQKVLSSWSKFTFTGEVRGMEFIESSLYVVIVNNVETNLVEMPLESGLTDTNGYVTHLDMRVSATVTNGSDTITLPYTPEDNSVEVYTDDGLKLNCANTGSTVTLSQPVTANTEVFVGIPYTMKYTFSEQLFKAKSGNGTSPSNAAVMKIRNGSVYFDKTAYFKVKVTPKFRDTYENVFTPDVVGSTTIGSLNLGSGFYRFPVFTKPKDTVITIENESALPSNFQSAEFESFVHSRSTRYA
jgi:hypothetical protein